MKPAGRDNRTKMSATGSTSVKVPTTPLYSSSKGAATKTSGFNPARVKAEHPPLPTTTPVQQGAFRKAPIGQGPMKMAQQAYSSSRPGGAGIPAMAPAKPMYGTPPPAGLPAGAPPSDPYSDAAKAYSQKQQSEPPSVQSAPTVAPMAPPEYYHQDAEPLTGLERARELGYGSRPHAGPVDEKGNPIPAAYANLSEQQKANLAQAFADSVRETVYPQGMDMKIFQALRDAQHKKGEYTDLDSVIKGELLTGEYGVPEDVLEAQIAAAKQDSELQKQLQLLQQQAQAGAMGIQGTGDNLFQMGNIQAQYAAAANALEAEMRMENHKLGLQQKQNELMAAIDYAKSTGNREAESDYRQQLLDLQREEMLLNMAFNAPGQQAAFLETTDMGPGDYKEMMKDLLSAGESGNPWDIFSKLQGLKVTGEGDTAKTYYSPRGEASDEAGADEEEPALQAGENTDPTNYITGGKEGGGSVFSANVKEVDENVKSIEQWLKDNNSTNISDALEALGFHGLTNEEYTLLVQSLGPGAWEY